MDMLARLRAYLQRFSWAAVAGVSRQVFFLLANAILVARLSPHAFGTLAVAYGWAMVFVGFSDFGLRQTAWRQIAATGPASTAGITRRVLGSKLVLSALAALAYLAVTRAYVQSSADSYIYLAYAPAMFFNAVTLEFAALGTDRFASVGRISVVAYASYAAAIFLTVRDDATSALVPVYFVLAMVLLNGVLWIELSRRYGRIVPALDWRTFVQHVREAWMLGLNYVFIRFTASYPVLIVGSLLSAADAGYYRIAEMGYLFVEQMGMYAGAAVFGALAARLDPARPVALLGPLRRILLGGGALAAASSLAFVVLLPLAVRLYAPGVDPAAYRVATILGAGTGIGLLAKLLRTILPGVNLDAALLRINVTCIGIGVVMAILLVLRWGAAGMAIALLLAEALAVVLLVRVLASRFPGLLARSAPAP